MPVYRSKETVSAIRLNGPLLHAQDVYKRQHKGSARPLGNLANEALRMKRMETHQVFDNFWKERGMSLSLIHILRSPPRQRPR